MEEQRRWRYTDHWPERRTPKEPPSAARPAETAEPTTYCDPAPAHYEQIKRGPL